LKNYLKSAKERIFFLVFKNTTIFPYFITSKNLLNLLDVNIKIVKTITKKRVEISFESLGKKQQIIKK
jgi:hypothetical protein